MEYCSQCESLMVPDGDEWICMECGFSIEREKPAAVASDDDSFSASSSSNSGMTTNLERLETSDAGNVKKSDAMSWLERRENPNDDEIKVAMIPKPSNFSGSTFPTEISNIRVTGDPEFIETIAGLFKPILDLENPHTRVEINLQQIEHRDEEELTDNYALYLSVAERG